MKIGFLITARLKSTRLEKKLLLKLRDREMIRWMTDRIKQSEILDQIVICTSDNIQDQPLVEIAREEGISSFCGHEDDVVERLYEAGKYFGLDYILNITADCPLVSVEYFDTIVSTFHEPKADLIRCLDLPHGMYSYGIKVDALRQVMEIKDDQNTEVWGRYFTDNDQFKVTDLDIPGSHQRPDFRLTLDYAEDFRFFEQIFDHFGGDTYKTPMDDIIQFLDDNPDIPKINIDCKQKFQKNWDSQNKMYLKK